MFITIWAGVATTAALVGLTAVNIVQDAVLGTQGVAALTSTEVSAQLQAQTGPIPQSTTPTVGPIEHRTSSGRPSAGPTSVPPSTRPTPDATPPDTTLSRPTATPAPTPTAAPSSTPAATQSPTPTKAAPPSSTSALIYSTGGSVVAQCTGAQVRLVSTSPAQGFSVRSAVYGPAQRVKIVFRPNGDGDDVELAISCHNGAPGEDSGDSGPDD